MAEPKKAMNRSLEALGLTNFSSSVTSFIPVFRLTYPKKTQHKLTQLIPLKKHLLFITALRVPYLFGTGNH